MPLGQGSDMYLLYIDMNKMFWRKKGLTFSRINIRGFSVVCLEHGSFVRSSGDVETIPTYLDDAFNYVTQNYLYLLG